MSIATTRGDNGRTSLIGGRRVSKATLRIDAIGSIDELGTLLAFARSICPHPGSRDLMKEVQRQLFAVAETLAADPEAPEPPPAFDPGHVHAITSHVHRLEAIDGILLDWALAGDNVAAAACEMARAGCRRAERSVVHLMDAGEPVDASAMAYLNRLADLLWLMGRFLEQESSTNASLRTPEDAGPRWSRAW